MNSVSKIQHKGQVTIPTRLRIQAGLQKGDLVEFSLQSGKIIITPKLIIDRSKFPDAAGEYTAAQRRIIDRGIAQSLKEYRQGKAYGPYQTHAEFINSLHKESAKISGRKNKRPAR